MSERDLRGEIHRLRDELDRRLNELRSELRNEQTHALMESTEKTKDEILGEQAKNGESIKRYDDVEAWVENWFVHAYARSAAGGGNWCAEWWRHPEAERRLRVMWEYWEEVQGPGHRKMYDWYTYADAQFKELTDSRGTFVSCGPDGHGRTPPPLATITVEKGYPRLP